MTRYRLRRGYRRPWRGRLDPRGVAAAALAGLVLAAVAHASSPGAHPGSPSAPAVRVASPAGGNVALGRQLAAVYGWGHGPQWRCLDALWVRESGWSATAQNPQSGAYGIAQALGHGPTNQYPAGPANPPQSDPATQIRWGLGYIATSYVTPCGAWAHEEADGWY